VELNALWTHIHSYIISPNLGISHWLCRGTFGEEKCKVSSTVVKWHEALRCNYFPFQINTSEEKHKKWNLIVWPYTCSLDSHLPHSMPKALALQSTELLWAQGWGEERVLRTETTDWTPRKCRMPGQQALPSTLCLSSHSPLWIPSPTHCL
jgi:hypothetical protein